MMLKAVLICPTFTEGKYHILDHFQVIRTPENNNTWIIREKDKPNQKPFQLRMVVDIQGLRGQRFDAVFSAGLTHREPNINSELMEHIEIAMAQKQPGSPMRSGSYYEELRKKQRKIEEATWRALYGGPSPTLRNKFNWQPPMHQMPLDNKIIGKKSTFIVMDDIQEVDYNVVDKRRAPVLPKYIKNRWGK